MLKIDRVLQSNRQSYALIGMSPHEFALLLPTFTQLLYEHFAAKERQRAVGGVRKGALVDAKSKLFFILFYLKVYPTYDLAGFIFGGAVARLSVMQKIFKSVYMGYKTLENLDQT